MMPQKEVSEAADASQDYGRYEGDQPYGQQAFERPYQQTLGEGMASKVYAPPTQGNKNTLLLILLGMSLVATMMFAVICLVLVGGTGGWISFCAACLTIIITTSITIDKIK